MQDYNIKLIAKKTNIQESAKLPYLNYGIFFSILIHIALFFLFNIKHENHPKTNNVFYVEVLKPTIKASTISDKKLVQIKENEQPPTLSKRQIVDDSSMVNNILPKESRLLAQNNNSVKKEQIKRGDTLNKDALRGNQQKIDSKDSTRNFANINLKTNPNNLNNTNLNSKLNKPSSLKQNNSLAIPQKKLALKLDNDTLFKNFSINDNKNNNNNGKQDTFNDSSKTLNYKPFSRAQGSGARFLGTYGSSSFLPNLPDGDLTLLNTKAEYFAVFVRRVATRVFSELRLSGWESLSKEDIYMIKSFSEVEAVMSLRGDIVSVKLLSPSGSFSFDEVLKNAVLKAAKDGNPPSNAKSDDNLIHFIFQAKSWSKLGANPNGSYGERRWLLLSTGLK